MKTVLYIDDSADDLFLFSRACALAKVSFQLQTIQGGILGMRYLAGQEPFGDREQSPLPQFMMLDIKMPDRDGFQVLSWMRSHPEFASIPVALYTSSLIKEESSAPVAGGSTYFIPKTPGVSTLINLARTIDLCLASDPFRCEALEQQSLQSSLKLNAFQS